VSKKALEMVGVVVNSMRLKDILHFIHGHAQHARLKLLLWLLMLSH